MCWLFFVFQTRNPAALLSRFHLTQSIDILSFFARGGLWLFVLQILTSSFNKHFLWKQSFPPGDISLNTRSCSWANAGAYILHAVTIKYCRGEANCDGEAFDDSFLLSKPGLVISWRQTSYYREVIMKKPRHASRNLLRKAEHRNMSNMYFLTKFYLQKLPV